MENYIFKKHKLFYLFQKENYEMLKTTERELLRDFLEKYTNNYLLFAFSSGLTFILVKKLFINKIKHHFFKTIFEFSVIFALTKSTKFLFDRTNLGLISNLDETLDNCSYLCRNSILLTNATKIENNSLNCTSLFLYNLDNYSEINLLSLVLIRLLV